MFHERIDRGYCTWHCILWPKNWWSTLHIETGMIGSVCGCARALSCSERVGEMWQVTLPLCTLTMASSWLLSPVRHHEQAFMVAKVIALHVRTEWLIDSGLLIIIWNKTAIQRGNSQLKPLKSHGYLWLMGLLLSSNIYLEVEKEPFLHWKPTNFDFGWRFLHDLQPCSIFFFFWFSVLKLPPAYILASLRSPHLTDHSFLSTSSCLDSCLLFFQFNLARGFFILFIFYSSSPQ